MAVTATAEALRRKDRVVAAVDMPGIPAGTAGKVMTVAGFDWIRYWVRFGNGVSRGSLDRKVLARPEEWKDLLERRERGDEPEAGDATADGAGAAGPEAAPESSTEGITVGGVTVPGHLLERSKSRREALGK